MIVVHFIYLFSFSYPLTLNFEKTENKLCYFVIMQITNSNIITYFDFTTPFEEIAHVCQIGNVTQGSVM